VSELLLKAARDHPSVLVEPVPAALFQGFGDISLNWELLFWILKTNNLGQVKSEVALSVMKLFEQAGIEIPSRSPNYTYGMLTVPRKAGTGPFTR